MPVKLLTEGLVRDHLDLEQALKSPKRELIKYFQNHFESLRSQTSGSSSSSASGQSSAEHPAALQTQILIDWYVSCVTFGIQELFFDVKQINIFLAIVDDLHNFSCSTCFANQRQAYQHMRELLLAHSVNQAPWKLAIF